jgi:hypothetical protein
MAQYHLWHPAYVAQGPATLECFATLGDAFCLSRGTDAFVREALAALDITAAPQRWTFEAMRTHYFSSYRDTPEATGAAAWDLAWRLRVELAEAPLLPDSPAGGYFDFDGVDGSWGMADDPDVWPAWPCLVLADAPSEEALARARTRVMERFPDAELTLGEAYGDLPQLRCVLGERPRSFYEDGAGPAEALLSALVSAGASVRFDATLRLLGC